MKAVRQTHAVASPCGGGTHDARAGHVTMSGLVSPG
jgi:hypothetical protein